MPCLRAGYIYPSAAERPIPALRSVSREHLTKETFANYPERLWLIGGLMQDRSQS